MKKKVYPIVFFIALIVLLFSCYSIYFKDLKSTNNEPETVNNDPLNDVPSDTGDSYNVLIKNVSELVFRNNYKYESMTVYDMNNNAKLNIISELTRPSSGSSLLSSFNKYFGSEAKLELDDIYCMDDRHKKSSSNDERILYKYDRETDRFTPNLNHKSHGTNLIILLDNAPSEGDVYISQDENGAYLYEVKPMFIEGDTYNKKFEKVFTSYKNFINKKSIGTIEGNKRFEIDLGNGNKTYNIGMAYDYYSKYFDTYIFKFVKENNNLIFSEYYKKA